MSEQRERWADGASLRALNERATRAMGSWRLSACVILRKECLSKVLNERATRVMGRWRLSVYVVLCKQHSVNELRERSEQFIYERSKPS